MRVMRLWSGARGTWSEPSPSYVMRQLRRVEGAEGVMVMVSSSQMEREMPRTSKPGPVWARCQMVGVVGGGAVGYRCWRRSRGLLGGCVSRGAEGGRRVRTDGDGHFGGGGGGGCVTGEEGSCGWSWKFGGAVRSEARSCWWGRSTPRLLCDSAPVMRICWTAPCRA